MDDVNGKIWTSLGLWTDGLDDWEPCPPPVRKKTSRKPNPIPDQTIHPHTTTTYPPHPEQSTQPLRQEPPTYRPATNSQAITASSQTPLRRHPKSQMMATSEKHMIPYYFLAGSYQFRLLDKRQCCSVVCNDSWVRVEHTMIRAALYPLT